MNIAIAKFDFVSMKSICTTYRTVVLKTIHIKQRFTLILQNVN